MIESEIIKRKAPVITRGWLDSPVQAVILMTEITPRYRYIGSIMVPKVGKRKLPKEIE